MRSVKLDVVINHARISEFALLKIQHNKLLTSAEIEFHLVGFSLLLLLLSSWMLERKFIRLLIKTLLEGNEMKKKKMTSDVTMWLEPDIKQAIISRGTLS